MCLLAATAIVALANGVVAFLPVGAKPISPDDLPPETAAFKPGPNLDLVMRNCTACHSADYVMTQPRGPAFKKEFCGSRM